MVIIGIGLVLGLLAVGGLVYEWQEGEFAYLPLVVRLTLLVILVTAFLVFPGQPVNIVIQNWQPEALYPTSPTLLVDPISWFGAISVLVVALFLLLIQNPLQTRFAIWTLGVTAVSLLASLAANPITLLLLWTLLDGLIFFFLLFHQQEKEQVQQVVFSFAFHLFGSVLLAAASLTAFQDNLPLTFGQIPQPSRNLLLLAAFFHLRIWTPRIAYQDNRAFEPLFRLIPSAPGLMLLIRAAGTASPAQMGMPGYLLALLLLIISLLLNFWEDETPRFRLWMFGWACLVVGSAYLGEAQAALTWSGVLLLSGSLPLFLKKKGLLTSLVLGGGLLMTIALPFTPAWPGTRLFAGGIQGGAFVVGTGFLIRRYIAVLLEKWGALKREEVPEMVFPLLGGLLVVAFQAFILLRVGLIPTQLTLSQGTLWASLTVLVLGLSAFLTHFRDVTIPEMFRSRSAWLESLGRGAWQVGRGMYWAVGRFVSFVTSVVEGGGGVLWALLGAFFLISLLALWGGG